MPAPLALGREVEMAFPLDIRDQLQFGMRLNKQIEEEIRPKLAAIRETGGYIYHSDHSVPNDVSLSNYQFALDLVRKYGRFD